MFRRLVSRPANLLMGTTSVVSLRYKGIKSQDPTWEDDRWLEAELANKNLTQEERYALIKQREVIKGMMAKVAQQSASSVPTSAPPPPPRPKTREEELEAKNATLEKLVAQLLKEKNEGKSD